MSQNNKKLQTMTVPIRGGEICCYENADPDNPGVSIMYKPKDSDFEIDIVYIENTDPELEPHKHPNDFRTMLYSDVFDECYKSSFTITHDEIEELKKMIQIENEL